MVEAVYLYNFCVIYYRIILKGKTKITRGPGCSFRNRKLQELEPQTCI